MSVVATLEAQATALQQQLAASPTYRELEIIKNTLRQLNRLGRGNSDVRQRRPIAHRPGTRASRIHDVAQALMANGPVTTVALANAVAAAGVTFSDDPRGRIASLMSQDGAFVNINHNGQPAWWLANVSLPQQP